MKYSEFQPGLKARAATAVVALSTAFTVISLGLAAVTAQPAWAEDMVSDVRAALMARLPKTPITGLSCEGFGGLCEVVSGNTLFYVDETARYLVVDRSTRSSRLKCSLLSSGSRPRVSTRPRRRPGRLRAAYSGMALPPRAAKATPRQCFVGH